MKTLWNAFVGLLLIHLLAVGAFTGWLAATDRLDEARVRGVIDTFKLTIAEEKALDEQAAELEAEAKRVARQTARIEAIAAGPSTIGQHLEENKSTSEKLVLMEQRLQKDREALLRQAQTTRDALMREREALDQREQALEQRLADIAEQRESDNFAQAVTMYESYKPALAKGSFEQLVAQGQKDLVVDYLAAMDGRKAAAVLNQFKQPHEIALATELIDALRVRDQNLGQLATGTPAGDTTP